VDLPAAVGELAAHLDGDPLATALRFHRVVRRPQLGEERFQVGEERIAARCFG
jgi:hypothetical protein